MAVTILGRPCSVSLIDYFIFLVAVAFLAIGLILQAAGFGVFVTGRLDGAILIIIGFTMFWAGWVISGARGISCIVASILNMFDAASTVAFWNFESNPVVLAAGPTIFMTAKVACSLTIMLYARYNPAARKGGMLLAAFFAFIVAWNLSQHIMFTIGFRDVEYGILTGSIFSLLASAIVFYVIFRGEKLTAQAPENNMNRHDK